MDWEGRSKVECPICSSRNLRDAGKRKDGATVSECGDCGIAFLNPMPTGVELDDMYSRYFARGDGIGYVNYRVDWRGTGLDHLIWNLIERFGEAPSSLLDVGCAFGSRVRFFGRRGLRSVGVDMSREAVERGKEKGLDLHSCRFEDFDIESKFDVVTMIDFIEHLVEPRSWMDKLNSLTHPGSLVVILTPDFDCYHEYGEKWVGYNLSFEHVLFYNRDSLSRALSECGFTPVMSANVRTGGPTVEGDSSAERNASVLRKGARLLRLDGAWSEWRRIEDGLFWHRLIKSDRRENTLLVVARR